MALLADYTAGTVSVSAEGTAVTGSGTAWQVAGFREGDIFVAKGYWAVVDSVDSNTELNLVDWAGPELTDAPYRLRYMSDGSRASAQARQLIDMLGGSGSLEALASLTGAPDTIPMFTGPGVMELVAKTDLLNGLAYDVQVNALEDRDAYDNEPVGFAVLVSNVGDGRSAVYSRIGEAGNWSDPAYVTGPVGPAPSIEIGDTTTLAPGSAATVENSGTPTAPKLDFGIPAGAGFDNKGAYASGTAYVKGDVVTYNGSSYIAKTATTGNAPTNGTYWDLLAAKGTDGTGTGDVVGPAGSTDGYGVVMDGATGKKVKQTSSMQVDSVNNRVGVGGGFHTSNRLQVSGAGNNLIGIIPETNSYAAGVTLHEPSGSAAIEIRYSGTSVAAPLSNTCSFATRYSTIPIKFFHGGYATNQERFRIEANGLTSFLNSRIGVGTATPNASALLDLSSTEQGFLPPRMTTTQRDAITSPAEGLVIHNTTDHEFQIWNGTAWLRLVSANADGNLTAGYTATSKNLGNLGSAVTLAPSGQNIQHGTNNAAVTISAPTASGVYTIIVEIVNSATAGAVTLSGFTKTDGNAFTTTSGHKFLLQVVKTNSAVTATVKALQ